MTIVLAILLLALGGCLLARRQGHAWAGPALVVVTLLALLVGGVAMVGRLRKVSPAKQAMSAQASAAQALGAQVAAHVEGGTVLVLTYAPATGDRLFTDARWEGLALALTSMAYRLVAAGPQVVPGASLPPGSDFVVFAHEKLTADANTWLAAHPDTKAVVSLLPAPPSGLALGGRPLFAFAVAELEGWAAGLRSGQWKAALIAKRAVSATEALDQANWSNLFDLVTPATLADYQKNATP
jgi:hypothetical protein